MQSVRELIGEGAQEPKKTPNENPRYRGYVAVTDLEKIYTVFHYMEILFAVYDEDRSGSINSPEAEKAFPRFHNIIGSLASGRSFTEDELAAVFSYLLAHGKRPSTIGEGLSFYWWKQSGWSSWRFETDRSTLLKMFSSITD
jgi:hypothetical protein